MGAILGWIARIIATGERVAGRDRETPPAGPAALASWYSARLDCTLDVLTATDGPSQWWVDLDGRAEAAAVPGDARTDTAVRGTQSDLLLWLTNRGPVPGVEVLGRQDVAARWAQLRR